MKKAKANSIRIGDDTNLPHRQMNNDMKLTALHDMMESDGRARTHQNNGSTAAHSNGGSSQPMNIDGNDTSQVSALSIPQMEPSSPSRSAGGGGVASHDRQHDGSPKPTTATAAAQPPSAAAPTYFINSSNNSSSMHNPLVTFAMPAVVDVIQSSNNTNTNMNCNIKSTHVDGGGGRYGTRSRSAASQQRRSATGTGSNNVNGNFSGASSGSLSSEDHHHQSDHNRNSIRQGSGTSSSLSSGSNSNNETTMSSLKKKSTLKHAASTSSSGGEENFTSSSDNLMSSSPNNLNSSNHIINGSGNNKNPNSMMSSNRVTSASGSNSGTTNSRTSASNSGSSGSGSDGNEGGATSSSNPAVVTASNGSGNNTNTTSSGSGSDGGSGSGDGNRRSGGEASADYYYAGYGSGSLGQQSDSQNGTSAGTAMVSSTVAAASAQHSSYAMPNANVAASSGQPGFNYLHRAIAASNNVAHHHQRQHQQAVPNGGAAGMLPHIVVATDDALSGGLPPPSPAYGSHLRHHSNRHYHHRSRAAPQDAGTNVAPPRPINLAGMPYAASHHLPPPEGGIYALRLPPADEQDVLQRVPQAQHATVIASNLPPPPMSSDAWSSASGGSSSRNSRVYNSKRPAAKSNTLVSGQPPSAASNGTARGSVNTNKTSSTLESMSSAPNAAAVRVSMDDPILKPSMFGSTKKVSLQSPPLQQPLMKSSSSSPDDAKTGAKINIASRKRKMSTLARGGSASDDSSDSAEAAGSGSEEGYEASSSSNAERQSGSGSSGSDSVSSDDVNKDNVPNARVSSSSNPKKKSTSMLESQTNSKRTETSSMSSSVLADFSSVMNEEESLALNSLSASPRSSCTSLSSKDGGNELEEANKDVAVMNDSKAHSKPQSSGTRKRGSLHLCGTASAKRAKHETNELKDGDIDVSAPGNAMKSGLSLMEKTLQQKVRSTHHQHYHSRSTGRKMLEESFLSAKRDLSTSSIPDEAKTATALALESAESSASCGGKQGPLASLAGNTSSSTDRPMKEVSFQDTPIYSMGTDVMALVVSFLEVPESHSFLTTPFSRTWLETYTAPQELWKILCTSKPFYAQLEENSCGSSDVSTCSFPLCNDLEMRHLFGRYRLLYTSFVRCMKYLDRLKDDALSGRTPSSYTNSNRHELYPYNRNGSLKAYFARARRIVRQNRRNGGSASSSDSGSRLTDSGEEDKKPAAVETANSDNSREQVVRPTGPRLGRSMLTDRLLRPTGAGEVDNVNLPWSCAIYSVVNWMVAFADVEGIQVSVLFTRPINLFVFCLVSRDNLTSMLSLDNVIADHVSQGLAIPPRG